MKPSATVAVITRTQNRPVFLERAIESVLNQTCGDWLHVIVNDGGWAEEVDLLVRAHESSYRGRVLVLHHEESRGMQNASNAGIAATDSEYLIIHDDDDSWSPDFLEKTVAFLEGEGKDSLFQGVVTQTTQIIEEVNFEGEIIEQSRQAYYPFAYVNLDELRRRNLFPPIAFLYRRSVHDKTGLFRQEFDVLGDHDFNLRFLRHFEIGVIPTYHAYYHWRHTTFANTVTGGREKHRQMLNRLKNAYAREALDDPKNAIGSLEKIDFPPPSSPADVPVELRSSESPAPAEIPDFKEAFDFDVLSLDIFDTVLKRKVHRPKDVFRLLEGRAEKAGMKPRPYALMRVKAERAARVKLRPEVFFEEIYAELASMMELSAEEADQLKELELALEKELLVADPFWLDLYRRYREAGIRILFASDMYYPSALLCEILTEAGYEDPEVIVSCEVGSSKHKGGLQPALLEKAGVGADRVLHIGDNYISDFLRMRESGIQAFHWSPQYRPRTWYEEGKPWYFRSDDLLSSKMMAQVEREAAVDPWAGDELYQRLGYEVAGPLYLSFLLWVLREAEQDGIGKLILVGRDGFYWEKSLDLLKAHGLVEKDYAYLHASRKVFSFASFRKLDEDAIRFLSTPNPALRVRDFIDRTGIPSEGKENLMAAAGFENPDEVITNELGGKFLSPESTGRLRNLFELLKGDLESRFAQDREGLLALLKGKDFSVENCALVDIGWNASGVRSFARLLETKDPDRVVGYYFGTWDEARATDLPVRIKSFFMQYGEPFEHASLLRESINWIESLHSAPHPTLLSLHKDADGRVEPVFAGEVRNGFLPAEQNQIWAGASEFLDAMAGQDLSDLGKAPGHTYLFLVLNRLLREPSPREVETWGKMRHSEGFGLEIQKQLIESPSENAVGQELLNAYEASNWKRGFLASLKDWQRNWILGRLNLRVPDTLEDLRAALNHKIEQAEDFWREKEAARSEAAALRQQVDELEGVLKKVHETDVSRSESLKSLWETFAESNRLHEAAVSKLEARIKKAESRCGQLQQELERSRGELSATSKNLSASREELKQSREEKVQVLAEYEEKMREIREFLRRRTKVFGTWIMGRPPDWIKKL